MTRVHYETSDGGQGQIAMALLRTGDIVRMAHELHILGAHVARDELGTVTDTEPLRVRVQARDDFGLHDIVAPVDATAVAVVLHPDDDRIGRSAFGAGPTVRQVHTAARVLARNGVDVFDPAQAATYLTPALRVAAVPPAAWQGFLRTADDWTDDEIETLLSDEGAPARPTGESTLLDAKVFGDISWALTAMRAAFERKHDRAPDPTSRRDVLSALHMLAGDLEISLPDDLSSSDKDDAARASARLYHTIDVVDAASDEEWSQAVDWLQMQIHAPTNTPYAWMDWSSLPYSPTDAPASAAADDATTEPSSAPAPVFAPRPEPPAPPAATTPARALVDRVPILFSTGDPRGGGRARLWATPGMAVFHKKTKQRGVIEAIYGDDSIEVRTPDGIEQWDANDTRLDFKYDGPVRLVDSDALALWQTDRTRRQRANRSMAARLQ